MERLPGAGRPWLHPPHTLGKINQKVTKHIPNSRPPRGDGHGPSRGTARGSRGRDSVPVPKTKQRSTAGVSVETDKRGLKRRWKRRGQGATPAPSRKNIRGRTRPQARLAVPQEDPEPSTPPANGHLTHHKGTGQGHGQSAVLLCFPFKFLFILRVIM